MSRHPATESVEPRGTPAVTAPSGFVVCPYCSHEIAAGDFAPWTARTGLFSAGCQCGRTVTMAAVTLQRRTAHRPAET